MTYIEYAKKLGINLTSAQIEILNLLEEHKDERVIITFPRMMGRQMLCNLIERKKGYEQGRADEREAILGLVDWKAEQDVFKRKIDIHIDFAEILTTENVLRIITEQLKQLEERKNET